MFASSMKVRSFVFGGALFVFAGYAIASPITIPPMPPTVPHHVQMAASPITIPPMPPTVPHHVQMAASPITIPPMPPTVPHHVAA